MDKRAKNLSFDVIKQKMVQKPKSTGMHHFYLSFGSLTVIKSKNIGKPLKYGFLFVKFLFLYVVCVVIMI